MEQKRKIDVSSAIRKTHTHKKQNKTNIKIKKLIYFVSIKYNS